MATALDAVVTFVDTTKVDMRGSWSGIMSRPPSATQEHRSIALVLSGDSLAADLRAIGFEVYQLDPTANPTAADSIFSLRVTLLLYSPSICRAKVHYYGLPPAARETGWHNQLRDVTITRGDTLGLHVVAHTPECWNSTMRARLSGCLFAFDTVRVGADFDRSSSPPAREATSPKARRRRRNRVSFTCTNVGCRMPGPYTSTAEWRDHIAACNSRALAASSGEDDSVI